MEVYDESTQTGFVKPYDNFICRLNLFFYNNPYNIYTEMKSLTHYYNKANNYYTSDSCEARGVGSRLRRDSDQQS